MKAIATVQGLKMGRTLRELPRCKQAEEATTHTITTHTSNRTTNEGGRKIKGQTYITPTTLRAEK